MPAELASLIWNPPKLKKGVAMREYHGLQLDESFDDVGRAAAVLRWYFAPLSGKNRGFTGGVWDTFDPSGERAKKTNEFTADDLASCALLSAPIRGRATVELLTRQSATFSGLLERVGEVVDFVDVEIDGPQIRALTQLFTAVRSLHDVGLTRTTKLLARKRPRLAPIVDGVLKDTVFGGGPRYWAPLHRALIADGRELWSYLEEAHAAAGLDERVTTLRVFDVLAWMDGSGQSRYALD